MQQPADVIVRPAIKHVPCSVVPDAHERIVRCGLRIVPVSSETEDKFEDAMEVTASSPLVEIDRVEIRSTTHLSSREHISCVHFFAWTKSRILGQNSLATNCGHSTMRRVRLIEGVLTHVTSRQVRAMIFAGSHLITG